MKVLIAVIVLVMMVYSAVCFGQEQEKKRTEKKTEKKEDKKEEKTVRCELSPEQKNLLEVCVKARKRKPRVRRRKRRRVRQRKPSQELLCYRHGGQWKGTVCVKEEKKKAPSAPLVVNVRQEVKPQTTPSPLTKATEKPPQIVIVAKPEPKPESEFKKDEWWWIGLGALALGIYTPEKRELLSGLQGKALFAINDRFRVSGMAGGIFWQKRGLLLGIGLEVRLGRDIFLTSEFTTLWGGFKGLAVKRRTLLGGLGFAWWLIKNRLNISASFLLGARKEKRECNNSAIFISGNFFTANIWF